MAALSSAVIADSSHTRNIGHVHRNQQPSKKFAMTKQGSRLHTRLTNLRHSKCDVQEVLASHPIVSTLQIIVPESTLLQNLVAASAFHVGTGVQLGEFVAQVVASGVFKHGKNETASPGAPAFAALALGPAMDRHGGIAIAPDGTLHLAVSSEVHQQLGLVGTRSMAQPGTWVSTLHSH